MSNNQPSVEELAQCKDLISRLAVRWGLLIEDDARVIENPEATKRQGVLERNRLMTVNDVRREMLNDLRAAIAQQNDAWTETPPKEQGTYWHWNGDRDSAPVPIFVLYSGFSGKCFVTKGQLGMDHATDCDQYGGWWMPLADPELPGATKSTSKP